MKYLKTFENIDKNEYIVFKRMVYDVSADVDSTELTVYEITGKEKLTSYSNSMIPANQIYKYYEKPAFGDNLVKSHNSITLKKSEISDSIYQSDNLQEVLDILPILVTTDKYNL